MQQIMGKIKGRKIFIKENDKPSSNNAEKFSIRMKPASSDPKY